MIDKKFPFHPLDSCLQEITYQEIIDTVYSSEVWKDEIRVKKVFDELLKNRISEAKIELKNNMSSILKEIHKGKD